MKSISLFTVFGDEKISLGTCHPAQARRLVAKEIASWEDGALRVTLRQAHLEVVTFSDHWTTSKDVGCGSAEIDRRKHWFQHIISQATLALAGSGETPKPTHLSDEFWEKAGMEGPSGGPERGRAPQVVFSGETLLRSPENSGGCKKAFTSEDMSQDEVDEFFADDDNEGDEFPENINPYDMWAGNVPCEDARKVQETFDLEKNGREYAPPKTSGPFESEQVADKTLDLPVWYRCPVKNSNTL